MITGLGINGVTPATAVLLEQLGDGRFRPISLGIRGTYGDHGTLDDVDPGANCYLLLDWIVRCRADGSLRGEELDRYPAISVPALLAATERSVVSTLDGAGAEPEPGVYLGDRSLMSALIAQPVWDAISAGADLGGRPERAVFGELFSEGPAMGPYTFRESFVGRELASFAAVDRFLSDHDREWSPYELLYPDDVGSQWHSDDLQRLLNEAQETFHGDPVLEPAFREHQHEIDRFRQDEIEANQL